MSVNKGLYTTGMIVDWQSDSQINDQKLSLWRKFPLHSICNAAGMNQISDILFVCLTVNNFVMKVIPYFPVENARVIYKSKVQNS
jgi:hypothetical protein